MRHQQNDPTPPLDHEYPYENEVGKEPENAWPDWLHLSAGLIPIYVAPPNHDNSNLRSVAVLGRFRRRPYLLLKIFERRKGRKGRGAWEATHYSAFFGVEEFGTLCLRLNDLWQRRLARPAERGA